MHLRRLSILRESFSAENLKFLEHDIPLMALTATATIRVREDILKSLCMTKDTKIVLTSFFRPNLRFSVSVVQLIFIFGFHLHMTAIIYVLLSCSCGISFFGQ